MKFDYFDNFFFTKSIRTIVLTFIFLYTLPQLYRMEYMQFLVYWGFDSEEIFLKSRATPDYSSDIIWTTYL